MRRDDNSYYVNFEGACDFLGSREMMADEREAGQGGETPPPEKKPAGLFARGIPPHTGTPPQTFSPSHLAYLPCPLCGFNHRAVCL